MTSFIAKKSLGQHFLHAPNVVGAMIHAARIESGMTVLEIGPGKGILTSGLLKAGAKVIAVEKDERAVEYMKENFATEITLGKLKLVQDDILTINQTDFGLEKGNYIIAANIPYYITGEILRKFLTAEVYPSRMVLLVQKEVAKRIVAADKKESILSISCKAYGQPKYIDTVPKRFFRPMPKVDSAIILIDNISKKFFSNDQEKNPPSLTSFRDTPFKKGESKTEIPLVKGGGDPPNGGETGDFRSQDVQLIPNKSACSPRAQAQELESNEPQDSFLHKNNKIDEKTFFDVVKAGFAHKRKVLRGNLAKVIPAQTLEKLWKNKNWPIDARAETFTLNQWKELVQKLEN